MAAAGRPLQLGLPDPEIIDGWNSRIDAPGLKLSGLSPFVNLVSFVEDQDIADFLGVKIGGQEQAVNQNNKRFSNLQDFKTFSADLNRRFRDVRLINDSSETFGGRSSTRRGVLLAEMESQIQSLNQKGGVGITSLEVQRGTKESLTERFNLSMTFTDAEIFDANLEYTPLIILNSIFLMIYGWSGGNGDLFTDAPIIGASSTPEFDLAATNKGYWRAALCRLYKFDFSFDQTGQILGTLGFMSPHNATLTFLKNTAIRGKVTELINGEGERKPSTEFMSDAAIKIIFGDKTLAPTRKQPWLRDGRPGLKEPAIITDVIHQKEYLDSSVDPPVTKTAPIKEEVKSYYYLGWVFEAFKKATNDKMQDQKRADNMPINFEYRPVDDAKVKHVYKNIYNPPNLSTTDSEDFFETNAAHEITNVFEIPLKVSAVDDIISNTNLSLLNTVKQLIDSTTHDLPGVILGTKTKTDGAIEIFVANGEIPEVEKNRDVTIFIEFGSKNSLCESIDLTSALNPNAYAVYRVPVELGDSVEELKQNLEGTGLDKEIDRLLTEPDEHGQKAQPNPTSLVSKLVQQDMRNFRTVTTRLLSGEDIFSRLLGRYLKRTSIVVHGITNIEAYTTILVKGVFKRLSGTYTIIQVTEQLNQSSFTTNIEASLVKPFDSGVNLTAV